jgi:hypothetical protein
MMKKTLASIFLLTLLLATASCKKSEVTGNQNANGDNASDAAGDTSSTPPFATKEPEQYQATRFITSSEGGETTMEGDAGSRTLIARDGDRRREDYEAAAGEKISYLQLPEGIYVLLPAKKLYAELNPETSGDDAESAPLMSVPPDFSPDKLLNETRPESRYEKLGAENLNGRATTKYRVVVKGKTGAAQEIVTESIVWVDESLGMPIKTETTSTGAAGSWAKFTMELRDIKETVDAGMFELPADYQRVAARELFVHLNQAGSKGRGRE